MWPNPQFPANLVTFNEEILNRKLHFCAGLVLSIQWMACYYSVTTWRYNTTSGVWDMRFCGHEGGIFREES